MKPSDDFHKVHLYLQQRNRQYSVSEPFARSFGFTLSELLVLIPLHFDAEGNPSTGCTQTEIVRRENLTKQTVSLIVRSFAKAGIVSLETNPDDRRTKLVKLTEEGRRQTTPVINYFTNRWNRAMAALTSQEYASLMGLMTKLADNIEDSFSR